VGIVPQKPYLFSGTVASNLGYGKENATEEEMWAALRTAQAEDSVRAMPGGLDAVIAQGGSNVSGGQRQRLAIARALLGNPRLLILDEATSHLDAESERIIQNNLKKILQGRTSVIIAHRLSTVRHADLILVLDRGVLVESGTHEELITKKGHYFYLNQQQLAQTN
jgi:ATP-binding cassette subfamily B protein